MTIKDFLTPDTLYDQPKFGAWIADDDEPGTSLVIVQIANHQRKELQMRGIEIVGPPVYHHEPGVGWAWYSWAR